MNRGLSWGLLLAGLLFAPPAFAFDAFNNYFPGDTYDLTTSYTVAGTDMEAPLFLSPHIVGSRFTSAQTGVLAVIRISLHDMFLTGFNQVDVRLYEADPITGDVGPIMAAFTRGPLPPDGPYSAPETISSFDPDVVLTAGNMYLIVVAPGGPTTEAVWNWSLSGAGDRLVESFNNGLTYSYREGRRGAMRVEVIPEPATLVLVYGVVAALAFRRARR